MVNDGNQPNPNPNPNPKPETILIVEDELPMRTVLGRCLKRRGYKIITAQNGVSGLATLSKASPDLILLDIMMPKLDGFSFCHEARRAGCHVPILVVTAKGSLFDRVHGLDIGADDYLVKPFKRDELLARVRALLRRAQGQLAIGNKLLLDNVVIDFAERQAWRDGRPIHLTAKEFSALRLLADNPRMVISRAQFLRQVWGYHSRLVTRTVDRHINSLRSKLEPNPERPRWIQTVHGDGYRFDPPEPTSPGAA